MTDAAVPVTQSAVEQFTERYLRSIGCEIQKRGPDWSVGVPAGVETVLPTGDIVLTCGREDEVVEADGELLHPESQLFQEILTEAGQRAPIGKVSLTAETTTIEPPPWLTEGDVELRDAQFVPYYDRTAGVVLFHVGVETVSEYQREYLRAIALDVRSGDVLETLEQTYLDTTSIGNDTLDSTDVSMNRTDVESLLDDARTHLIDRVQGQIDEIHEDASRAADAEVEEYRQMQQQRLQELQEQRTKLSTKIDELNETIDGGTQSVRIEALKERKGLRSDLEEVEDELEDLKRRREHGFPERQREIRTRHALDVRITPLTVTEVEYERGEVELELVDSGTVRIVTTGYGNGVGFTEPIYCSSCNRMLTEENPLGRLQNGIQCESCIH
jgi:hypothetical protein